MRLHKRRRKTQWEKAKLLASQCAEGEGRQSYLTSQRLSLGYLSVLLPAFSTTTLLHGQNIHMCYELCVSRSVELPCATSPNLF